MIGPKPFHLITYKQPKLLDRRSEIKWFVGVDSEAYTDGIPFLFCSSERDVWTSEDIPDCFFEDRFNEAHFVLYNMKYDSGAILRCILDSDGFRTLARYGAVEVDDGDFADPMQIRYMPHKYMLFQRGRIRREFWDIAQYYHCSLDKAAQTYLGQGKIKLETKRFARRYVRKNWKRLVRYCIRDARLTARLADHFKSKLNEFGVPVKTLYSPASLAFGYFNSKTQLRDVWRPWELYPQCLQFAHEAYQGGKFECTHRGAFDGYEYDIVSAYPFEMANLLDIQNADYIHSRTRVDGAAYAYLRCRITHHRPEVPPCHGLLLDGVRVYAHGSYHATITLNEYLYLLENGIDVVILDGWWIVPNSAMHPYRSTIEYLFGLKDQYKGKDAALYSICKLMMNSYYGRMANLNEEHVKVDPSDAGIEPDRHGEYTRWVAGSGWNPIYASVITANTRIAVSKLQMALGDACLAVHTDSVICTTPLPDSYLSKRLGGLSLELQGSGLILGCGMYDMADHCAYRGFEMRKGFTWRKLLESSPGSKRYKYKQVRAASWTQATAWDRMDAINVFETIPKHIDLNADVKRDWPREVRGRHLLAGLEHSMPRHHSDRNPWRRRRLSAWDKTQLSVE